MIGGAHAGEEHNGSVGDRAENRKHDRADDARERGNEEEQLRAIRDEPRRHVQHVSVADKEEDLILSHCRSLAARTAAHRRASWLLVRAKVSDRSTQQVAAVCERMGMHLG